MKRRVVLLFLFVVTFLCVWLISKEDKVYQPSLTVTDSLSHDAFASPKSDVEKRQEKRQSVLKNTCQRLNTDTSTTTAANLRELLKKVRLFYSDKYKFIVCEIPKCGCTSVKKILLVAEGVVNETDPENINGGIAHLLANEKLQLSNLDDIEDIAERIKTYYKLMIVRDPMYRLLSAYRDKMEVRNAWSGYLLDLSKKIHAKYSRKNDSKPASFDEFLSYIIEPGNHYIDRHWEMFHKLCQPCLINYDFIAHIESIDDDMPYVMEKVKMTGSGFPKNKPDSKRTDQEKVARYLETVPRNILDKIYDKYRTDYELFGFAKP